MLIPGRGPEMVYKTTDPASKTLLLQGTRLLSCGLREGLALG